MSTTEPFVSIVTPIYNGQAYLVECIESVLAQTYENWEYVIVNNCSTDRSLEIAQEYARRDERIRVHDNDSFLGQFANWNHAMRQMSPQAQYCKILHADDWLFPNCLAQMVALCKNHPSVAIVGAYRLDETKVTMDGLPYPSTVVPGRELCRRVLLGGLYPFGSPSSLLLRSSVVRERDPFYNESVLHADTKVCFDILQDHDYGFVHQVLTFTRRHNESVTSLTHKFDTRRLSEIAFLLEYGPVFLKAPVYQARRKQVLEDYHRFLAQCVLERRDKAFWQYHSSVLAKLGAPISKAKVAAGVSLALLDMRQATRVIRGSTNGHRADPQQVGQIYDQRYPDNSKNWDSIVNEIIVQPQAPVRPQASVRQVVPDPSTEGDNEEHA